jgi:hypothetical protein
LALWRFFLLTRNLPAGQIPARARRLRVWQFLMVLRLLAVCVLVVRAAAQVLVYELAGLFSDSKDSAAAAASSPSSSSSSASLAANAAGRWKRLPLDQVGGLV